jgi:DNA-3-methyladenine glycosylase I
MQHTDFAKPTSASGYLEAMVRVIMTSGINWHVVDAKWEGMREAFSGFDVERVAKMTSEDVERLVTDPRIIRNRRKIEAIIDNAAKIAELDRTYGGFDKFLSSHQTFEEKVAVLKREFSFMGDSTAYFFLAMVGEKVPDWEQHAASHHR